MEARFQTSSVGSTVAEVLNLYLDDSGTRHPDHASTLPAHNRDWFGLGGVLLRERDEDAVRAAHATLCAKWKIEHPLHSHEIRGRSKNFRWLGARSIEERSEFLADIGALATRAELLAIACVIDRPGYNARYREKYGRDRWLLCKTAFTVVVERAVKQARRDGAKLRVLVEKSDKKTDRMLEGYYNALRTSGHPFDQANASRYAPLDAEAFRETLYEFRPKAKTSPPMQLADLVLWPMCIGGYDPTNAPYVALRNAGTLLDTRLDESEIDERGIKYSCWDLVGPKKPEPDLSIGLGQPPKGDLVG